MGHLHIPHIPHIPHLMGSNSNGGARDVPKGCLAVKVGYEGEEKQRFVIPIIYFNHPLFLQLLKEAEDEYGFDQKGTITLPCDVTEFRNIQDLIDREYSCRSHGHSHGHGHMPLAACFKA